MPALGGVARRATIIEQERKQNAQTLVLDAGDSLAGDQDPAVKTQGRTSIEVMNRLGYDAMALGPADLALGPAVLRQRMAEARFPLLSANAVISPTGELVTKPYAIREMAGHRVAILGLSGGPGTAEIGVNDPLAAVQKAMAGLKGQADIVIVLSHAGPGVDQQIADQVPGIAAIVSGGQPALSTAWRSDKTGTVRLHADMASAGHAGRFVGIGRLDFDAAGRLSSFTWQPLKLGPEVADQAAMAAWVEEQNR